MNIMWVTLVVWALIVKLNPVHASCRYILETYTNRSYFCCDLNHFCVKNIFKKLRINNKTNTSLSYKFNNNNLDQNPLDSITIKHLSQTPSGQQNLLHRGHSGVSFSVIAIDDDPLSISRRLPTCRISQSSEFVTKSSLLG